MALTGKFLADFSDFYSAVAKAEVSLRSFETGSSKVGSALNRMTDQFSGRRIISEATLMVEAVGRVGGTSKLTATELARVGTTATEAAAKMKALGIDVPPGLQKIADATKNIGTAATGSTSVLSGMAGQLTRMFTVGAVIAFGREVLAAGDNIQKMADQTGLGTDEVQRLQYIAGQSGTSMQSLVGAVQNLQQRIGDHDTGAAGAMRKLGVNAEAFNKLSTYSQMTSLAEAVRSIKDPTEQASIAADLFGKTWKEILPAIKAGMVEVGNQAPVMADSTVQALDRVGDALTRAKAQGIAWGGSLVTAIEGAGFAFGDFLSKFNPEHFGIATSEVLKLQKRFNDPDGLKGALASVKPPIMAAGEALKAFSMSAEDATLIGRELTRSAEASIEVNRAAAAATAEVTKANIALEKSQRALANYIGEQQMAFIAADMKAAAAEVDSALTVMREDFIRVTAGDAKLLASEVGSVVDAMVADLARANAAMTADAKAMAAEIDAAMGAANRIPKLTTDTDAWAVSVNALSRQFEQLANIAGDSFGGFARWAGTVTASLGLASESTKQWSAGLAQFKSGDYTAGFAAMGSSIMGIASSFMAATNSSSAFQNTLGSAALGAQYGAQFGGPWGAAIGSVIGGLAGLMKSVFGGPSAAEMAGREAAEQYRAELEKTLTATQKLEAGNEAWKKSIIAIRDAYIANGATQAEAMAASERLWAAEKKGPEAVKAEIEKISAAMSNYTAATAAIEEFTAKNASFAQANLEVSLEAIEKERKARLDMLTGIGPLMDEARRLIDDFYNHERDIALETMDTIEDRMRRKGYMTRAELQKEADAAVRAYDQMLESGLYTADVLQRAYKDAMDKIDAAIGNTAAKAKDFADKMKYYDRGFGQTGQDARSISPEQAQAMIDRFVQTGGTAAFAEDFLASNQGDEHRLESAYASSRDNQEAQLTAAQMAGSQGRDEFASGTHGQYLDFGTGKDVRLHGRERVMNEAEGKAESGAWSGMAVRLASIERMLERMLKDQPRQIRDAILTAR